MALKGEEIVCSVTVNNAGRLLSFSISLGIPMLFQRTRKFSLQEFKEEGRRYTIVCDSRRSDPQD